MSDLSDAARVQVLLADHAAIDASNKINALGVGFQYTILQPGGFTAPAAVVVLAEFPAKLAGEQFAIELALYNDANELVQAPGLMGDESTPLRFAQNVSLQAPIVQVPGLTFPKNALWARHQMLAAFQNGVPVAAGMGYEWRVSIDGLHRDDWTAGFYVPAPSGGLVLG